MSFFYLLGWNKLTWLIGVGDLVGLKVSHDFDGMDEGDARILTLKDSRILDNEGAFRYIFICDLSSNILRFVVEDELQNVEMAEEERRQKNQQLKIKKRDYTGYDDDEFVEGSVGMKRAVLAKYDEDIEGAAETVRVLLVEMHSKLFGSSGHFWSGFFRDSV